MRREMKTCEWQCDSCGFTTTITTNALRASVLPEFWSQEIGPMGYDIHFCPACTEAKQRA